MKKIIVLAILMFPGFLMACESSTFEIFYIPIEVDFYMPFTREYIMKYGTKFQIDSCLLYDLFNNKIYRQDGISSSAEDYGRLRIMIIDNIKHIEIFITQDKKVLSLVKKIKYNVDINVVDDILKELKEKSEKVRKKGKTKRNK
jgi:hypothetical protein